MNLGHRFLWEFEVTTIFHQEVLSASKCPRLQEWTVFIKTWGVLWDKKIEIHIGPPFLKKIFIRATIPILDLVTWSVVPLWLSSIWENKATHIFKKLFFKVYHQVFIPFVCVYKPVLPYKWYSQVYHSFSVLGDSFIAAFSLSLQKPSCLFSFKWMKVSVLFCVFLQIFFYRSFDK